MIFVDTKIGSNDLVPLLEAAGLPVTPANLGYADVEFGGRGIGGQAVLIGVEVKRLTELTGDWDRFAGEQVPKMQRPQYDHRWLVYQGEWMVDRGGSLSRWAGKRGRKPLEGQNNALALRKKLITLEMCAGFHKERTYDRAETVEFLRALYRFWTDDDLDEHKSHLVLYEPLVAWGSPSIARRLAAILPGIGQERSAAVEKHFKDWSIIEFLAADKEEWMKIDGIGEKTATTIVNLLRERTK